MDDVVEVPVATVTTAEEGEEDEEEVDDEDVEASLDEILKERLVVEEEETEDEEVVEPDDRCRGLGAGPAQAARRVRVQLVFPGQDTPASWPTAKRGCAGTACEEPAATRCQAREGAR